MVFAYSGYVDPGTMIGEVIVPGAVSVTSERTLALVGIAPRTRRAVDEAVTRGKVYDEALTLAAATPFIATLSNTSNRDRNAATLYMNDNELGLADWWFLAAALVTDEWAAGTVDVSSGAPPDTNFFTISLDGKRAVTIDLNAALLALPVPGVPAAATAAKICEAINYELGNAAGTYFAIYGASYSGVATHATGVANEIITITSPLTNTASDVKIFLSRENDAAAVISGLVPTWVPTAGAGVQAPTIVRVADASYNAAADYTLDYVTVDVLADALTNAATATPLTDILTVGTYPGNSNYTEDTDFEEGAANDCDWDVTGWAQATITSVDFVASPPIITAGVNDRLFVSINGRTPLSIPLTASFPAATTPAQVVIDINSALDSIASVYGPEFAHVAVVAGNTVVLTAPDAFENYLPEKGQASTITFSTVATDAFTTLFGTITQPYTVTGVGRRPAFGSTYYCTYDYTRPTTDYSTAFRVYDPDQLYEYTTRLNLGNYINNALCVAGDIAFENGASSLYLIQINDSTDPGTPTQTQIDTAIAVAENYSLITDILTLDTSQETMVTQMLHVADQSSILEKHYRRGWFGMARGTDVGDPDTVGTLVYAATQTLQPGNTSSARGRLILVAPPEASRTLTMDTGQEITVDLDGTYVAAAVAAIYTALPSPSSALIGKLITGFNSEGFETYLRGERYTLAGNGTTVVTLDAGRFVLLDPLTTEAGGGKVVQFEEPASSAQKDAVTRAVDTLLTNNVVGIVPDDLSDFLSEIKKWILLGILANINNGSIASYRDASGLPRDIDATTDIQVFQSATDPRTFYFKYWFNLKYPAKRFFGEYSVDNPFFAVA